MNIWFLEGTGVVDGKKVIEAKFSALLTFSQLVDIFTVGKTLLFHYYSLNGNDLLFHWIHVAKTDTLISSTF